METDDRALLDRTALGESDAFAALLERHLASTLGHVRPRVESPELAFDVTAETFAAVVMGAARHTEGDVAWWISELSDHKLAESIARGRVIATSRRRLLLGAVVLSEVDVASIEQLCATAPAATPLARISLSDRIVAPGGRRWRAQTASTQPAVAALAAQLCAAVEQAPDVIGLARRSVLRRLRP